MDLGASAATEAEDVLDPGVAIESGLLRKREFRPDELRELLAVFVGNRRNEPRFALTKHRHERIARLVRWILTGKRRPRRQSERRVPRLRTEA